MAYSNAWKTTLLLSANQNCTRTPGPPSPPHRRNLRLKLTKRSEKRRLRGRRKNVDKEEKTSTQKNRNYQRTKAEQPRHGEQIRRNVSSQTQSSSNLCSFCRSAGGERISDCERISD
ncbi:hypothetical protein TGVAND_365200 [Toxoplasma gondii VAND]|uniref:Uncharacterized protein n=2 Tax=Toxoplasma gondii TaxID=5811 RepID=A0A3R8G7V6_TOXGO|nr:hypothetical protein TGVAND_365200 [Toxoplasma gondii VAND]RQX70969.1 hypothetical protein TGCAST_365200 [Toxoplasma gondii CAST]